MPITLGVGGTGMTIRYRDVSHYQPNYVPVGPTCAKATEGSTYVDPEYATIRQRTLAGGWPFLPYHFLRPHTIASIASQVAHVISVVGRRSIMLDVEKEPLDTLAEQRELRDDMYAFADQYAAAGGRVTLAYFPRWEEQAIGSPSLTGLTARGIGLVSSNYTTYSDTGPGWAPYGGVTPVIWQYTSTPYDTNAFKGTEAELAQLWAHGIANSTPEVDMPLTTDDAKTLVTADVVPNFPWAADAKTNPTIPLTTAILTAGNQAHAAYQAVGQVVTLLTGLPAAIVAGLPTVGEGAFTPEQIAQIQASVSTSLAGIKVTVSATPAS